MGGSARARGGPIHGQMQQVVESVALALGAIWANKLRSFLTVLGNLE